MHTSPYISQRMLKWPPTWQKGFNYRASKVNLPKRQKLAGSLGLCLQCQALSLAAQHNGGDALPGMRPSRQDRSWLPKCCIIGKTWRFFFAGRQAGSENNTIQVHSEFRSFKCIHPPIFYHRFSTWGHRNTERTQAPGIKPKTFSL